ncbi:hypothetical protein [Chitinimonas prasina]|nr:hypothetical protein [Chitinimonas prasina]
MFRSRNTLIAAAISALFLTSLARAEDEHANHHPTATSSSLSAKPPTSTPAPSGAVDMMETQMRAMRAMREKMAAAKTTEEHQRMMPEQLRLMKDGMAMMKQMSGMSGMSAGNDNAHCMADRQKMREMHMEMMESMMQMMTDRMPPSSAK